MLFTLWCSFELVLFKLFKNTLEKTCVRHSCNSFGDIIIESDYCPSILNDPFSN